MGQIVSFIIQKGGCGKTTTTVNIGGYLATQGYKVLTVDIDPQGNLTQHFGYDSDSLEACLTDLFMQRKNLQEVVIKRDENLHILPNNISMTDVEFSLFKSLSREYILRDVLHPVQHDYDFILIDCPPNLGILSVNALVASTEFIMTVAPEFFPMKAIKPLYDTYSRVKSQLNRTLRFKGVVMTLADFRTRHSQEVRKVLERNFPQRLYKAYVRNSVSLKEASSMGKTIFEYDPQSIGAFDYQNVAEEFLLDHGPARQKMAYYEEAFQQLPEEKQTQILEYARSRLSSFNKSRLDDLGEDDAVQSALVIERNKVLERLFPYRHQTG